MITCVFVTACSAPLSILDPAGTAAREAATLWWGMFTFFTIVLCAVIATGLYAIWRSPNANEIKTRVEDTPELQRQHQAWIIGGGIILPTVTIVTLLVIGIPAGHRMAGVGSNLEQALHLEVTGHQWWWEVRYPDSAIVLRDEVHIPAGLPVRLSLTSADVIHSFWVPRIGQKLDMIPGHVNELYWQADTPGVYAGVCAEFCGLAHAHMRFTLHVHTAEDFAVWQSARQTAVERELAQ